MHHNPACGFPIGMGGVGTSECLIGRAFGLIQSGYSYLLLSLNLSVPSALEILFLLPLCVPEW